MLWDDGRFRTESMVRLDKYRVQSSSSSQANEASAVERPGSEQKAADLRFTACRQRWDAPS